MPDRTVEYLIRLGIDPAVAAKTLEAIKQIKKDTAELDAQAAKTGKTLSKAAEDAFRSASSFSTTARAGTTLGRTSEALNGLGLTGPGSALADLGNVGKVAGDLARLKTELIGTATELGDISKNLPGLLGAAATQGSALAAALGGGGLTAALAAVAAIALPVTAAVAAIAVAYKSFVGDTVAQGDQAIKDALVSVKAYYQAIIAGDTEQINSQIKRLEAQKRVAQQEYDLVAGQRDALGKALGAVADKDAGFQALNDRANELKKTLTDTTGQVDGLNRALHSTAVAAADAAKVAASNASLDLRRIQIQASAASASLTQAEQTSDALEKQAAKNKAQLAIIQGEINAIFNSPAGNTAAGEQALKALADEQARLTLETDNITRVTLPLVKAREAEADRIEKTKKAILDYAAGLADLRTLEKDRAKALEDRTRTDVRGAVEAAYQARINAAKITEQMAADQKARDDILKEQQQREKDAAKSFQKSELDAARKFHESELQLGKSYMDSQLQALAAYQREEKRANDQYAKDRLRATEDLNDKLLEDAVSNDAASFITDQKAGIKALQRQAEDHDDEAKLRIEAFAEQQKEAERQYTNQLQALRDQFGKEDRERQQAYRDEIAQIQQQVRDKLEQDRIAHQNRVTQSQQLQNELDALKDQWARDDEARRRQIEDEGYQASAKVLKDSLEKEKAYWVETSDLVTSYWENTKTTAQNAIENIKSLFGGSASSTSNNSTRAAANRWNQIAMKEFGEGGQVFANQPVIVGDLGRPEVFVPQTGGQIIPMDRFGGPSIELSVGDINIGAGNAVTRDEVAEVLRELFVQLRKAIPGKPGGMS